MAINRKNITIFYKSLVFSFIFFLNTSCTVAQESAQFDQLMHWHDGPKRQDIWMTNSLVADFSNRAGTKAATERTLIKEHKGARIWKLASNASTKSVNNNNNLSPVFRAQPNNGALQALPGGVVVILNPTLEASTVEEWLDENDLTIEKNLTLSKYAFLIQTAPGIESLELANQLIENDEEGIVLNSSPNWWSERHTR